MNNEENDIKKDSGEEAVDPQDEKIIEDEAADTLSEDELSMLRASFDAAEVDRSTLPPHDTSDKATLFRTLKKSKFALAVAICAAFVALSLVIGAVGGCALLVSKIIKDNMPFVVMVGEEELYSVKYKEAEINGIIYVDMLKIAEFTDMTVSGSDDRKQFTAKNGSYLLFENNKRRVTINGGYTDIIAVNTEGTKVYANAYVNAEECLVPYTFLSSAIGKNTLKLEFDEGSRTLTMTPKYIQNEDKKDPDMADILFVTDNFDIEIPPIQHPIYTYSYPVDINEYIVNISSEHLMLANKTNPLGRDFVPSKLKVLECATAPGRTFELEEDAANALYAMMLNMEAAGITDTYVTSAYRSYDRQDQLYRGYVNDHIYNDGMSQAEAEAMASTYSARAGESEHQTGLCFDFTTYSMGGALNENFENQKAFAWLEENAYKYGFILRYPKDKVDITGYDYEPWHYRFVGRQAASEMHVEGKCLEEYLEARAES